MLPGHLEIDECKRLLEEGALEIDKAMFFESELAGALPCCRYMLVGIGGTCIPHPTGTLPIPVDRDIWTRLMALAMPRKSAWQDVFEEV